MHRKIPQVSYKGFNQYYGYGLAVFTVVLLCSVVFIKQDAMLPIDEMKNGYLMAVCYSGFFFYPLMKRHCRSKQGAVLAALVLPVVVVMLYLYALQDIDATLLLCIVNITIILVIMLDPFLWNWEKILASFLCSHWSVAVKMPVYKMQRTMLLHEERKHWNKQKHDTGFVALSCTEWAALNHQDKVMHIQSIALFEINALAESVSCHVVPYSISKENSENEELQFLLIESQNRLVWNEALVDKFTLNQIVEELIITLQQYFWYQRLPEYQKNKLYMEVQKNYLEVSMYWHTLLYAHLEKNCSMKTYDVLTRHYAKAKSDWYCLLK